MNETSNVVAHAIRARLATGPKTESQLSAEVTRDLDGDHRVGTTHGLSLGITIRTAIESLCHNGTIRLVAGAYELIPPSGRP